MRRRVTNDDASGRPVEPLPPAKPPLPVGQAAVLAGLPPGTRGHVERGKPPPTMAIGVDAHEMSGVEHEASLLSRMADDRDFA